MKKATVFFASALMLASTEAMAQAVVTYAMETPTFALAHEDTDKYETLDSCYLTVSYRFNYRGQASDEALAREDIMDLQMGRKYNAFFSRNLRDLDRQNTQSLKTTMQFSPIPENYVGFDILTRHADASLTVTNRIPFTTQVIGYAEGTPSVQWTYLQETDSVMGYLCHAAIGRFGGREWKVYYTDAIPLPYGPWKLGGAKGLILKAVDAERNFVFEAVGLTQKPQEIVRFAWSRKTMGKEEWMKFERDMHRNAGAFVRNTGARIIIMDNSERGFHRLNEDWEQYYNPLEK